MINWAHNLLYNRNVRKRIAQNTLGLCEALSQNRNTAEKNNQVKSFRENIAAYHEDNTKLECTLWPQRRYSLLKWAVGTDNTLF
jgi:hypothetical protein